MNIGSNGLNKPAVMHGLHLLNLDLSETTGGSEAAILIRPSTVAMDDVLIEGCSIRNVVSAAAIWVHNTVAEPVDKVEECCTRLVIRGNRIDGTSDNGIINRRRDMLRVTARPLIPRLSFARCALRSGLPGSRVGGASHGRSVRIGHTRLNGGHSPFRKINRMPGLDDERLLAGCADLWSTVHPFSFRTAGWLGAASCSSPRSGDLWGTERAALLCHGCVGKAEAFPRRGRRNSGVDCGDGIS